MCCFPGRPVIMPSPEKKCEWWILAGGTRVDAVYIALDKWPDSPQVKATVAGGLTECVVFDRRTPADVLIHTINHANEFHRGSPTTFVQVYSRL